MYVFVLSYLEEMKKSIYLSTLFITFSAKPIKCRVTSATLTIITLTRGVKNARSAQKTPILLSRAVIKRLEPVDMAA